MTLGFIGIIIALTLFLYGAYKNVSVLYLAPISGAIVAAFNGINIVNAFQNMHVGGFTGMIVILFPTIFLGALLGKIYTDCGAAESIAILLVDKFVMTVGGEKQVKRAVLAILLVTVVLTFGGVDGFVLVFSLFPIVMIIAKKVGIPRRFVPAMLVLGSGANSAPGVPMINNIVAMAILGTDSMAAAIPGFISFVVIEIGIYYFCSKFIIQAMRNGETFSAGPVHGFEDHDADKPRPGLLISLIPVLVVFICFAIIKTSATTAITSGIVLAIALMSQYMPKQSESKGIKGWFEKIIASLNDGSANAAGAIMTLTAAAGFAAVVTNTEVFGFLVDKLLSLPLPPMITSVLLIFIVVALTSSPPVALQVCLPIIAGRFIATGAIDANAMTRVSSIAVSTFETLPVNGIIILTTGLARVKIQEAYKPMFYQTVIMTTVGTLLCMAILAFFPGLA